MFSTFTCAGGLVTVTAVNRLSYVLNCNWIVLCIVFFLIKYYFVWIGFDRLWKKVFFWKVDTISLAFAYSCAMIFLKAQFTNWTSQENCVLCNCVQKIVYRLKNPKNNAFIDNNSPKETWAIENLTYDISWTLWSVYTKFGWFRPTVAEKISYKKLKRKGMSRREKNEIFLMCPCAKKLHSARL